MLPIFPTVRLLIVADNPFARAGIAALLNRPPQIEIVGQVAADLPMSEQVALYRPSLLIWEVPFDTSATVARLGEIKDLDIPTLVLLGDDGRMADVYAAGARGILPQNTDADTIAAAIMALAQDLIVLSPELPALLATSAPTTARASELLTERELEVIRLVAEGLPNKQIAHRLGISEHTVKFHLNALMGKLGAQSRTEAVVRATRAGLIAL
ncbi:MAG: response regulator transcription factor [Chloroflexota bacterium]|nr:response regulator transcription factor [Chloroflexota bacterium]